MLDERNCRYISASGIIELTRKETYLLAILIDNRDKVVTHEYLAEKLYGIDGIRGGISARIGKLRKKLAGVLEIKTKVGLGYYL